MFSIKKGNCNNYIITFNNRNDMFLIYQTFNYNSPSENKNRIIKNVSQKSWTNEFQENNYLYDFTLTTVINANGKMYIFVINSVKICNGKMKFYVTHNTINNMTNDFNEDLLEETYYARFDIDAKDAVAK